MTFDAIMQFCAWLLFPLAVLFYLYAEEMVAAKTAALWKGFPWWLQISAAFLIAAVLDGVMMCVAEATSIPLGWLWHGITTTLRG